MSVAEAEALRRWTTGVCAHLLSHASSFQPPHLPPHPYLSALLNSIHTHAKRQSLANHIAKLIAQNTLPAAPTITAFAYEVLHAGSLDGALLLKLLLADLRQESPSWRIRDFGRIICAFAANEWTQAAVDALAVVLSLNSLDVAGVLEGVCEEFVSRPECAHFADLHNCIILLHFSEAPDEHTAATAAEHCLRTMHRLLPPSGEIPPRIAQAVVDIFAFRRIDLILPANAVHLLRILRRTPLPYAMVLTSPFQITSHTRIALAELFVGNCIRQRISSSSTISRPAEPINSMTLLSTLQSLAKSPQDANRVLSLSTLLCVDNPALAEVCMANDWQPVHAEIARLIIDESQSPGFQSHHEHNPADLARILRGWWSPFDPARAVLLHELSLGHRVGRWMQHLLKSGRPSASRELLGSLPPRPLCALLKEEHTRGAVKSFILEIAAQASPKHELKSPEMVAALRDVMIIGGEGGRAALEMLEAVSGGNVVDSLLSDGVGEKEAMRRLAAAEKMGLGMERMEESGMERGSYEVFVAKALSFPPLRVVQKEQRRAVARMMAEVIARIR